LILAVLFFTGLGVPTAFSYKGGFEFCTNAKGKYRGKWHFPSETKRKSFFIRY